MTEPSEPFDDRLGPAQRERLELHRIVTLLFDTHYDDLTDRIPEIERYIEDFRWCDAAGKRVAPAT